MVVALHGHQAGGHARFFQAAAHGIGHLLGGMPHGVVDHHGALLGLEEIEECRAESEIDCQAAAQESSDIIKTEDFNEQA